MLAVAACGRVRFDPLGSAGDGGGRADGGGRVADADLAGANVCTTPNLPDLSSPTAVVGNGTLGSCDEAAVRNAVTAGGTVKLDCGMDASLAITSEIVVTRDTVIDAGGLHFDGGRTTRIFHVMPSGAALSIIGGVFQNGSSSTSGGAILMEAGSLLAYGSVFSSNAAALASGVDGGGAIAASNAAVTLYGCVLSGNTAANGGAIQASSDLSVGGTVFAGNAATGTGGSTGQGGLGGAINATGAGNLTLCAVNMTGNTAGTSGGGLNRVSSSGTGTDLLERVRIEMNTANGGAGGAYVEESALRLRQVGIVNNSGNPVGGLWYTALTHSLDAENVFIADNSAQSGFGAGMYVVAAGTLRFATVANNHAACATCYSVLQGAQNLTLTSTVVANNYTDGASPASCMQSAAIDGGTNFQWPTETPLCAAGAQVADPMLGALVQVSGPAGEYMVRVPAAGSPVTGAVSTCPAEDVLGKPRPSPCAAGAVEP